jgi:acetylornithine aminotransferase
MLGIEFKGEAGPVLRGLRDKGVLATKAGDRVLRLLPPLVVKPAEIRQFLTALGEVLSGGVGGEPRD